MPAAIQPASEWISSTAQITKMQTKARIGDVPPKESKLIASVAFHLLATGDYTGGTQGKIDAIEHMEIANLQEISSAMSIALSTAESKKSNQGVVNKLNTDIAQYTVDCSNLKDKNKESQEALIEASSKVTKKINSFPSQDALDQYKRSGHMEKDKEFQELEQAKKATREARADIDKLEAKVRSTQSTNISLYNGMYNPEIRGQITPQQLKNKAIIRTKDTVAPAAPTMTGPSPASAAGTELK